MIRVMVAEDNIDLNNMYCKFLTKDKDIKIISQTTNGKETLKKYYELKPDLLLLDLEMPKMNGLEIIDNLNKDPKEKENKNIFVISGNADARANLWNMAKVYISVAKPVDLDMILRIIKEFKKEKDNHSRDISKSDIKLFLADINVQTHKKNTMILVDAIQTAYNKPFLWRNINDLYKFIGEEKNINSTAVQWSIRNSIRSINKNIPDKQLFAIFHLPSFDRSIAPKYFFTTTIEYLSKK